MDISDYHFKLTHGKDIDEFYKDEEDIAQEHDDELAWEGHCDMMEDQARDGER